MRYSYAILVLLALLCSATFAQEGRRADSILLNGDWEFVEGSGNEQAQTTASAEGLQWQKVTLPGDFFPRSEQLSTSIKFIWARRTFQATDIQANRLAVLRWNHISFGAAAYINGQKVGENAPTGPYQVILPKGAIKAGENMVVLKIPGAAGVAKGQAGHFLIPAGFASEKPCGMPGVHDDVWIDFADIRYVKWALTLPDLASSKVRIRVTLAGPEATDDLRITATVKSWPDGKEIGKGETTTRFKPHTDPLGGEPAFVEVPMPNFKPWTHEDCNLYTATVVITRQGKLLDELDLRFGMREFAVADRRFTLNGRNLFLRGSNLVGEWTWPPDTARLPITGKEKDYLVTEARQMSMNSFRTHTQPLPRLWADLCDENGTMILAEFPCLYNNVDHKFTPEESEVFKKNVLSDAAGWMARLWNHPSVVMWVLSNESTIGSDRPWELGMYQDFVLKLDPTRPTMRAGDSGATKFNLDLHDCANTRWPEELASLETYVQWEKQASQIAGVTCTNSEYMNAFAHPLTQWTGREDQQADALACAQLGMEHTEVMRRLRYDGIWPFMYAGWTKTRTGKEWKAGFAQPISAALHSALSPVLASLDLHDANYLPGQVVSTDLWLINDSWHDARLRVDLLLTNDCPEFIPEAKCFDSPLEKRSIEFDAKADTAVKMPIKWKLPAEAGNYWLTARTTVAGPAPSPHWPTRPVLSQRFVRAVRVPEVSDAAMKRTFVLLGADDAGKAYFAARGLRTSGDLTGLKPAEHVVIVWNAAALTNQEKQAAKGLCDFAAEGGKVIVLAATTWDWTELSDVEIGKPRGSRVFAYENANHPLLSGIDLQCLMRWNGLPGTVATGSLHGNLLAKAQKILWTVEPKSPVAAEIPAATGGGKILFLLLDIPRHVNASYPDYDPSAENILLNALAG